MGRDRGKGKGGGRGSGSGGGKIFIENEEELAIQEQAVKQHKAQQRKRRGEEEGEEVVAGGEDNSEQEGGQEEGEDSVFAFDRSAGGASKASASALDNNEGQEDVSGLMGGLSMNPNRAPKQATTETDALNRKQREALAAQRAKEEYQRRHMAGETEQAKRELAQLAIVRARREEAKKKREAEGRAPGMSKDGLPEDRGSSSSEDEDDDEEAPTKPVPAAQPMKPVKSEAAATREAKKKAEALGTAETEGNAGATSADGGPPKLKAMDIKKMNADALKDHLRARNLDIQGQKKDLMKRLSDYEAARP